MYRLIISVLTLLLACSAFAEQHGDQWSGSRPDGHAPIGVMGDHTHHTGEVMLSYRFMTMKMEDNRDGTDGRSVDQVLSEFMNAPLKMTMNMHMFGAMYAPSDRLTLMAMVPVVDMSMSAQTRMGATFETESQGLGDIRFTGMYVLTQFDRQRVHANLGVSLPTGSIDVRGNTPAGDDVILPYPMQRGSGSVALLPAVTYLGQTDRISWGTQASASIYLGKNDHHYRVGNQYVLTPWVAYRVANWVSGSVRLAGTIKENYKGADPALNPMMVPTADPSRQGRRTIAAAFGLNFYVPKGSLKDQRLAVEFSVPAYQDFDGPQLEDKWQLTVGWQAAWKIF